MQPRQLHRQELHNGSVAPAVKKQMQTDSTTLPSPSPQQKTKTVSTQCCGCANRQVRCTTYIQDSPDRKKRFTCLDAHQSPRVSDREGGLGPAPRRALLPEFVACWVRDRISESPPARLFGTHILARPLFFCIPFDGGSLSAGLE